MYHPKTHPILDHKFVTGLELLKLYREIQICCLAVFWPSPLRNLGTKILNEGKTRFPENEVFYDLERSMLGNVYSELLQMENIFKLACSKIFTNEERFEQQPRLEKALYQLQQIMDMNKVDPYKRYYNRECFEEHFDLMWIEDESTSQ